MTASPNVPAVKSSRDFADLSIALVSGLTLTITALFLCTVLLSGNLAGARDFVSYWATGRQLVAHADPYDRDAMMKIERTAGLDAEGVLFMRNPPWALPIVYPLGLLGVRVAAFLWSLALLTCLFVSVRLIYAAHRAPNSSVFLLGLSFTPALICVTMGQTSLFCLLGLALFLRFHRTRPTSSGISLWLCALKPHLFLPCIAVFVLWIVVSRSYRVLAGAALSLAASSALAFWLDPGAWTGYLAMMSSPAAKNAFVPCLADAIQIWISPGAIWIQYVPALAASIWALLYFWARRHTWNWIEDLSPLLLVSLLVAPYCWFYDQGLAIPALLHGAYISRSRKLLAALALAILIMDIEICLVRVTSAGYLWTAPAWLAWYLVARSSSGKVAMPVTVPQSRPA
jgi:hypothetical protein